MKIKSKALLLVLCAVLLVTASGLGTMAYMTDNDSVTNTFTVGSVGLTLDEAKVNEKGQPFKNDKVIVEEVKDEDLKDVDRWQPTPNDPEQEYHLLPGHTYIKDPTVTIEGGSEESYVRMMVTVTFASALTDTQLATDLDGIFQGYDADKWSRYDKTVAADQKSITYEYRYTATVDGKDAAGVDADQPLEPLFTKIVVPGTFDNDDIAFLDGMKIVVVAHAIQAAGFDNADAAWTAFGVQHP